ncbi:uncharacterized protein LOC120002327 [Tripterygium wilfordii]|uniref:uncharacterized protein LOC120002327 n=1 Tax=Tripterygium wilfordii TaxID=458696 RepID=UPI0018F81A4B|nr:uncharacterized protein LOC120002327 [Tripterygium wilfordii]
MMLDVHDISCSSQLIHQLLLRQIVSPQGDFGERLHFNIGGKKCTFGIEDFVIITGLLCTESVPDVSSLVDTSVNRLKSLYFEEKCGKGKGKGKGTNVSRAELEEAFDKCDNAHDALKLALVYFVESVLMPRERRNAINIKWLQLVDDLDAFNQYPWGSVCYERTATSLACAMIGRAEKYLSKGKAKETYSLYGMPIVLQIWAYEIVPIIAQRYATKCGETHPRILKYSGNQTPTSDDIVSDVFELIKIEVHDALVPTEAELEKDYVREVMKRIKKREIKRSRDKSEEDEEEKQRKERRTKRRRDYDVNVEEKMRKEKRTKRRDDHIEHAHAHKAGGNLILKAKFDAIEQKLGEHGGQLLDMKKEIVESITGFFETTKAIYEGLAVLKGNWEKKEDKDGNQDEKDENDDEGKDDEGEKDDEGKDEGEKDDEGKDDEGEKNDEGTHDEDKKEDQEETYDADKEEEDNEGKTVSPVRHADDVEDAAVVAGLMDLTEQVFEQPMTDKSSIGVEEIPKAKYTFTRGRKRGSTSRRVNIYNPMRTECQSQERSTNQNIDGPWPINLKRSYSTLWRQGFEAWVRNRAEDTSYLVVGGKKLYKNWFINAMTPDYWLTDQHMDVAMYLLMKRIKQYPAIFKKKVVLLDTIFTVSVESHFNEFTKDPHNVGEWDKHEVFEHYISGKNPEGSIPLNGVDYIYFPMNWRNIHWVAIEVEQGGLQ